MKLLAVYGSLKRTAYNHEAYLSNAMLKGTSSVKGLMFLRHRSYPVLIDSLYDGDQPVEVYEVPDEDFAIIQAMELGAGYHEEEEDLVLDGDSVTDTIHVRIFYGTPEEGDMVIDGYNQETVPLAFEGANLESHASRA